MRAPPRRGIFQMSAPSQFWLVELNLMEIIKTTDMNDIFVFTMSSLQDIRFPAINDSVAHSQSVSYVQYKQKQQFVFHFARL